jgi:hypothetical protein
MNSGSESTTHEEFDEPPVDVEIDPDDEHSSGDIASGSTEIEQPRPKTAASWSPPLTGRAAPNWARSHRRKSPVRTLVMSAIGGIFGLALGYYALLWISGPRGDFLDAAKYLPASMLPREFQSPMARWAADDSNTGRVHTSNKPPVDSAASEVNAQLSASDSGAGVSPAEATTDSQAAGEPAPGSLINAPSFTADELAVSLRAAQEAQAGLVAGDFEDGRDVKRAKGLSYKAFCDLAQKATFVDRASRADYISALEKEIQPLFQQALADAHTQEEVAKLASLWLNSPNRTHGGIFFAGRVANEAEKGTVVEYQLDLGSGQALTVLVSTDIHSVVASASPLAVIGWVVDQPAEQVRGYTGDAPQAVWAGHVIHLD